MAKDDFVEHILELMSGPNAVHARKMFGGYGVFRDGMMFGLIAQNTLYLKVDDLNRQEFLQLGLGPFLYDKGGKPVEMSYYEAPPEALDSAEVMQYWSGLAFAAAQRAKKNKKK